MRRVSKQTDKKPFNMDRHIYDIPARVLIYKEDGEFVAHALEMDLLGYGATQKEAMESLREMILCQISFAHEKQDADVLASPAPKTLFDRWEKARLEALKNGVIEDKPLNVKYIATFVSIERRAIEKTLAKRSHFTPVTKACA